MRRKVILMLLLAAFACPAFGQSKSWDYKSREASQTAMSVGLMYLNSGKIDAAISALIQATGYDPQDPIPFSVLGMALNMKGRYNEALDALHKSYQLDAKSSETILSLGFTHYLLHDYDKALNAWRQVHRMNPELCDLYADSGYAYLRKGDFKKAVDNFRKLIDCHPNAQVAYQGLATIDYLMGNFAAASEEAEHAQSIAAYPPVQLLLAKLDLLKGNQLKAQQRIKQYLATTKPSWQRRSMTSIGYSSQHDFHWDPFLVDTFDNGYMLSARALNLPKEASRQKSLSKSAKFAQTIDSAKAAANANPQDYWLQRELALAYLANGQYADAADAFKKTLGLCPDCAVDLLHLGRSLALAGKAPEASGAVRDFQKKLPKETISQSLMELAKADPAPVPVLETRAPDTTNKPSADDAGF